MSYQRIAVLLMAITLVQSAVRPPPPTAGVNSTTLAFGSALSAGNIIVASNVHFQSGGGTTVTTPTDSLAHIFLAATAQQNNTPNTVHLRSFYVPNNTAGADTVTYDISGALTGEITAIHAEFAGVVISSPISGTPALAGPTTTTSPTTGNMTPADPGCLIIAVLNAGGVSNTITPPGAPWAVVQQYPGTNDTVTLSMIYQIQGAAAPVSATWGLSASAICLMHIFALKPLVVAAGTARFGGLGMQGHGR